MFPPQRDSLTGVRWLSVVNDSGEEMPAHAAVVVDSSGTQGEFTISKPTTDGERVWIAGPSPALDGDYATGTNDYPAWALYDSADGTPAVGETWGAGSASWKLRKNKAGFRVCGTPDTALKIVQVEFARTGSEVGTNCSSLLGRIREGNCFTLDLAVGVGSCLCVAAQSTTMNWDSDAQAMVGADYIYGCPPGVVTSLCPDGAPNKWSSVFAGFTGDYAALNGVWTWTYTTGDTWVATKSGITATLVITAGLVYTITFSGGTAAVNALQYTVSGDSNCCDAVTLSKV